MKHAMMRSIARATIDIIGALDSGIGTGITFVIPGETPDTGVCQGEEFGQSVLSGQLSKLVAVT